MVAWKVAVAFAGIVVFGGCGSKNPVLNNAAPVFTSGVSHSRNVAVDSSVIDTIVAVDPEGGSITYTLASGPAGMTMVDGVISWIPGAGDTGIKVANIVARDVQGDSSRISVVYLVGSFRFKDVYLAAEEIKEEVEFFRGKAFLRNVAVVVKTRSQYAADRFSTGSSGNDLSDAEKMLGNKVLIAEGFLRQGDDYWGETDSMLAVGVGGFYVPGSDSLWVIVADSDTVIDTNTRVSLFHEFVHALQDQYYSLNLLESRITSSDQAYALRYVIEGEAGYLDWFYGIKLYEGAYPSSSDRVLWGLRQYEQDINQALENFHDAGERFFVYQPLIWAYTYGPEFVGSVVGNMDWSLIDTRLFARLPVRTREVLEPAVYWAGNRTGFVVRMDSVMEVVSRDGLVLDYDEYGSVYTSVLLREWGEPNWYSISLKLVSDRIVAWGDSAGDSVSLCWYTHWIDKPSRDIFIGAYRNVMSAKYGSPVADLGLSGNEWVMDDMANRCYLESKGNDVYVLERYRTGTKDKLIDAARSARVLNWGVLGKISADNTKIYGRVKKDRKEPGCHGKQPIL